MISRRAVFSASADLVLSMWYDDGADFGDGNGNIIFVGWDEDEITRTGWGGTIYFTVSLSCHKVRDTVDTLTLCYATPHPTRLNNNNNNNNNRIYIAPYGRSFRGAEH